MSSQTSRQLFSSSPRAVYSAVFGPFIPPQTHLFIQHYGLLDLPYFSLEYFMTAHLLLTCRKAPAIIFLSFLAGSVRPSVYLYIGVSSIYIYIYIHHTHIHSYIGECVCLSACLSVHLSISQCLNLYLTCIYLAVCIYLSIFLIIHIIISIIYIIIHVYI